MSDELYADVAVPRAIHSLFTYKIPSSLHPITAGQRAWVPFGSELLLGMVIRLHKNTPDVDVKEIERVADPQPVVSAELLDLFLWMSDYYYCGVGEIIQAALPAGMNVNAIPFVRIVKENLQTDRFSARENEILDYLRDESELPLKDLGKRFGSSVKRHLNRLAKAEIIEIRHIPKNLGEARKEAWWDLDTEINNAQIQEWEQASVKWKQKAAAIYNSKELPAPVSSLKDRFELNTYMIKKLQDEGVVRVEQRNRWEAEGYGSTGTSTLNTLNEDQDKAFAEIRPNIDLLEYGLFLIQGITGSGKTEVYIHAVHHALEQGKGCMILVPEIALTPQTVNRFRKALGVPVAVLHSRLSERERLDEWKALSAGDKKVAIGARSAVFAPVQDLGLIVIDEEHDASYKQQDPAPRYHAREVAIMRAFRRNIPVVVGSATPSLQTLWLSKKQKARALHLRNRHGTAQLPTVTIIDLKQYKTAMFGPLSAALYQEMKKELDEGNQIILLLNRRGFSSFASCSSCGTVAECPHCSVSLTYHKNRRHLRCHYCGYVAPASYSCLKCAGRNFDFPGTGTQRIEEELSELFPKARLLRMDQDTTSGKDAHAKLLSKFSAGDADILIGTQLVAKGLDFPNVTLVGVLNADTELAFPTYRASERMFQLLSQVAGRAGRAEKPGKVIFQTRNPSLPALTFAANHDYDGFAALELEQRRSLRYPPFSKLLRIEFKDEREDRARQLAEIFAGKLRKQGDLEIVGPAPSLITRRQRFFYWELMAKLPQTANASSIRSFLDQLMNVSYPASGLSSVKINIHIDPLD